jgi:CRP-like cAMP-binding protein
MQSAELSVIAGFPLFAGLASEDLEGILSLAKTIRVPKNEEVFAQGAGARSFFVLVDGYVRATKTSEDGEEITVRYVSPGEIFGVAAAIGLDYYPATAVAVVDATILRWPSAQWPILAAKYPVLASNALRSVGSRLQDAHRRVIELTSEEVERRIARTLLRLADQAGRQVERGIEIEIPLRRHDVAQLTGTTLHSVSRVLSVWEQNEFVSTDHQRIVLCDLDALAAIADGSSAGLTSRTGA